MSIITKPYTAFPGDVIRSAQYNQNFDTIYNDYNGNITNVNISPVAGIHYGKLVTMSGDATITDLGVITVNSASPGTLLLPAPNPPTAYRQIALVGAMGNSAVVQVHDGVSAKTYLRTDTYNEATLNMNVGLGGMDAGFVDVAAGAQIVFTVNVPGRYIVFFDFAVRWANLAAPCIYGVVFRLTDGITDKRGYNVFIDETNAVGERSIPVAMNEVFNFTTTGSKTVRLQKFNYSVTNVSGNNIETDLELGIGTGISIQMKAYRIAD